MTSTRGINIGAHAHQHQAALTLIARHGAHQRRSASRRPQLFIGAARSVTRARLRVWQRHQRGANLARNVWRASRTGMRTAALLYHRVAARRWRAARALLSHQHQLARWISRGCAAAELQWCVDIGATAHAA
jgi:hypothetical protein